MARLVLALALALAAFLVAWMMRRAEPEVLGPLPEAEARDAAASSDVPTLSAAGGGAAPDSLPPRSPGHSTPRAVAATAGPGAPATPGTAPSPAPYRGRERVRVFHEGGEEETCVDIVFVGEGYRATDLEDGTYTRDVQRHTAGILAEIPFAWYRDSINVRAVFLESREAGCDVDCGEDRVETALDVAFESTKERGLALRDMDALRLALQGAGEVDALLVMVNSPFHGGTAERKRRQAPGSSYRIALFTSRGPDSVGTAVHELGHSLGGLADEYVEQERVEHVRLRREGKDVAAPNVQVAETLDRTSRESLERTAKWGHFLRLPGAEGHAWAHEGGHYKSAGMWRPWRTCLMRDSGVPFCPVCCEALSKAIVRRTGRGWDAAAWHAAHPLSLWKE